MFELGFLDSIFSEAKDDLRHLSLNYYRSRFGFMLCQQFINTQSLLDWSVSISIVDVVLKRVIQFGLEFILPKQLQFVLLNKGLSQLLSLACLSLIFQQPLLILVMSKTLYVLFYSLCQLFAHQPIQLMLLAYFFQNAWLVLPLIIKMFLSLLFLIDSYFSLNILKILTRSTFFLEIMNEFGIKQSDIRLLTKVHINRHELSYQYQEIMTQQKLTIDKALERFNYVDTLEKFRKHLAFRYHSNPAIYIARDGSSHILPLDWHHLNYFLQEKDPIQYQDILKAYYQHPVHTVWRMLQSENPWRNKQDENQSRYFLFQNREYLQWFLFIWKEKQASVKQEDTYIESLAYLYRLGNQEKIISSRVQIELYDNYFPDLPLGEESIQGFILKHLEISTQVNILTESKLKMFLNQFLKQFWVKKIMTLSHIQFKQLCEIWKNIMENEALWFMFSEQYQGLDLTLALKKIFEDHIKESYGDILTRTPEFSEIIDAYFLKNLQHDVEHHAISFNQAVFEVKRKTAIPYKI